MLSFYCKVINLHLGSGSKDEDREEEKKELFDLVWQGHEASGKVVCG